MNLDRITTFLQWLGGLLAYATLGILLARWYYFDIAEPRLRAFRWMRYIPLLAKSTGIFHYRLG